LNPDQVYLLPAEINKALENISKLKIDNLYQSQDEYYIFKFIDLVYNVKFLYDMYQKMIPIVEKYYEFDIKVQTQQKVVLNTNEPIENQVFYYQQELKNPIKEYLKEQLKGKYFEDILTEELDYLLMFPSIDFWIYGIYTYVNEIYKMDLDFLDYLKSYDIKNAFLTDLRSFQKYDTYLNYTIKIMKEKNVPYVQYINYFEEDINYVWMLENLYKNNLIPKDYFLAFSKQLLKNPLDGANQFIKIELYNLLNIATNTESILDLSVLAMSDEILKAKLKEKQDKLNQLMTKSTDIDIKTDKDILDSGIDVLAVLEFLEILYGNMTLDDITVDYDIFKDVLSKIGLIQRDIEEELYLINNGIINKDNLIRIAKNYIKTRLGELKDAFLITEFYNRFNSLPSDKMLTSPTSMEDLLPYNQYLQKQDKGNLNISLPEQNAKNVLSDIDSQVKNNVNPSIGTKDYMASFAIKNTLYMQSVTEEVKELTDMFPTTKKVKGCSSLEIARQNYEANKDKLTPDDVLNKLDNPEQTDTNLDLEGKVLRNENDPIQDIMNIGKMPSTERPSYNLNDFANNVGEIGNELSDYFTNISDSITSYFGNLRDKIDQKLVDPLDEYLDKLKQYNEAVNQWINDNINGPISSFVNQIGSWLSEVNSMMNTFLNGFSGILGSVANIIQAVLDGISSLISGILCALKAILCMLGMFLNIGSTINKTLDNLKNELEGLINSGVETLTTFIDSINDVVDSIMDTFGINASGLCSDSSSSYLDSVKNELSDLAQSLEEQFLDNFNKMVDQALSCKFKAPQFSFGRLPKFSFGFNPGLPPAIIFKIPKC
jgi:hypothetical protein